MSRLLNRLASSPLGKLATSRERVLALTAGGVLGLTLLYAVVNGLFIAPARALDEEIRSARNEKTMLERENSKGPVYERHLRQLAALTCGIDDGQVKELVFDRLMRLLDRSGLGSEGKVVKAPRVVPRSYYKEISWSVDKIGQMRHVLNLLYLLDADPTLHRLEGLTITPRHRDGLVSVHFRYVALSLATKKGKQFPRTQPSGTELAGDLNSEQRRLYDSIEQRDIFRPYIKRVEQPRPPPVARTTKPTPRPAPRPTRRTKYQVVSLSQWDGKREVLVQSSSGTRKRYKIGDELAGGMIVMVDYRWLPHPEKPKLLSYSRVIVKIDRDYWAVELGQYLADKRRLAGDQLPATLASRVSLTPSP